LTRCNSAESILWVTPR